LTVTVGNAPPVLITSQISVTPQRLNGGGTVTVTGAFEDASIADTHTVRIRWGDSSESLATVNEITKTFTATHTYLDHPSKITSAVSLLQAVITAAAGATASTPNGQLFVTVDHFRLPVTSTVAISAVTPMRLAEGGSVTVTGTFDAGVGGTHTVRLLWGDG